MAYRSLPIQTETCIELLGNISTHPPRLPFKGTTLSWFLEAIAIGDRTRLLRVRFVHHSVTTLAFGGGES